MVQKDNNTGTQASSKEFTELDVEFIRVLEDVIDALLTSGTLRLTDLPPQAIEKLNQRKKVRDRLRNSLDLLPDDDVLI